MGQTTGIDVKKHTFSGTSPTTYTFTHDTRGSGQWAIAVRGDFSTNGDMLTITVKQRIPGRSSVETDDDYFDDEPVALFFSGHLGGVNIMKHQTGKIAGTSASGTFYVDAEEGQQHIINVFWPPAAAELVFTITEFQNAVLKAVTSWEVG